MDNTNNKQYWNEYVTYWENKVDETNNKKDVNDKTNSDEILELYYKKLTVEKSDVFLDYGCGSGRLYPIYKKTAGKGNNNYFGIDVSGVCLEHAQSENEGLILNENLKEFDGLHIPFDNGLFDKIICFGVFDACNQKVILRELFRVLKSNGKIMLTGKNNKYFYDDEAALTAEVNARKKGHPNYFTNVHYMEEQLEKHEVKLLETYYFLRRGDFPKNNAVNQIPEVFYEWAILAEKTENYKDFEYEEFSDKYSDTFKEIELLGKHA